MAAPELVTVRDFQTSRYSQLVDNLDAPLPDILARAEAAIQKKLERKFKVATYTQVVRPTSQVIFTRHRPIVNVLSMRRRTSPQFAWQTVDTALLRIESGPGYIEPFFSVVGYDIELTYTAGYETIPEDIKEAIILQAVLFSFQDLEIYGSGDAKAPGILYMWNDLDRLIAPYRASATVYA